MVRNEGEWAVVENFLMAGGAYGSLLVGRYHSKGDAQASALRAHLEAERFELSEKVADDEYVIDFPAFEVLTFQAWSALDLVPLSAGMRPDVLRKKPKG